METVLYVISLQMKRNNLANGPVMSNVMVLCSGIEWMDRGCGKEAPRTVDRVGGKRTAKEIIVNRSLLGNVWLGCCIAIAYGLKCERIRWNKSVNICLCHPLNTTSRPPRPPISHSRPPSARHVPWPAYGQGMCV